MEEGPSQKDKRKIRLFRTDKKEIKRKIKDTILFTLKKNPNILVKISLQHLSKKICILRIKQKLLKQYPFLEPLFST